MRETGKPVWIIRCSQGFLDPDRFELNHYGLEELFGGSDVSNKLLALYSVAGATREEKSLMNFFLRYFYSEQSPDWIQTGSRNLKAYFNSKGEDTQGLVIWSQPFIMEHHGKQIALFLMDSQVRWKTDPNTSHICALSAWLSSMHIFNISKNVSVFDMEHLQRVANYPKYASMRREQHDSYGSDQQKSLQNLQLVIRDWSAPDQYAYGGRDGRDYLHEVVFAEHSGYSRQIEWDSTNEFDHVSCFLMPHPGPAAATRGLYACPDSLLTEFEPEFLRCMGELVDVLFSPGNVVPKQVNGNPITCHDFIAVTHSYFRTWYSLYNLYFHQEKERFGSSFQAFREWLEQQERKSKVEQLEELKQENRDLRRQVNELEEQLRDAMFHIEAGHVIDRSDADTRVDIRDVHITVGESPVAVGQSPVAVGESSTATSRSGGGHRRGKGSKDRTVGLNRKKTLRSRRIDFKFFEKLSQYELKSEVEELKQENRDLRRKVKELEEQLRDAMFHIEAGHVIGRSDADTRVHIRDGHITVGQSPVAVGESPVAVGESPTSSSGGGRRRGKGRKGRSRRRRK